MKATYLILWYLPVFCCNHKKETTITILVNTLTLKDHPVAVTISEPITISGVKKALKEKMAIRIDGFELARSPYDEVDNDDQLRDALKQDEQIAAFE